MVEVVQAGMSELAKLPYQLSEGLYVVGTGSTGAAEALAIISASCFAIMLASSLTLRRPHPSFVPTAATTTTTSTTTTATVTPAVVADVSLEDAMKASQFHLLGLTFFCLATGGMGMFSVAKPMKSEVFSTMLPTVVTSAFAAKFLLMLSAGNLGE